MEFFLLVLRRTIKKKAFAHHTCTHFHACRDKLTRLCSQSSDMIARGSFSSRSGDSASFTYRWSPSTFYRLQLLSPGVLLWKGVLSKGAGVGGVLPCCIRQQHALSPLVWLGTNPFVRSVVLVEVSQGNTYPVLNKPSSEQGNLNMNLPPNKET